MIVTGFDTISTYTCHEFRNLIDQLKKKIREDNKSKEFIQL